MADAPTLEELRALAPALPPSSRLQGSEVADVLSAVIAVLTHGRPLLDAAQEGGDSVYAFLHDHAAQNAPEGEQPVRGYVHAPVTPAAPAVTTGSQQLDYDKLAAAIVAAQQNAQSETSSTRTQEAADTPPAEQPASVVTPSQAVQGEGVAATSETPAGSAPPASETVTDSNTPPDHPAPGTTVQPSENEVI